MTTPIRIATWNVNSIKARLEIALNWLKDSGTEVVLLQELKCQTEAFPYEEIESLGYNCAVFGQKTYNGVAILSKSPIEDVQTGIIDDTASRYIEGYVYGGLKVASIYVPNGQEVGSEKFAYKMRFYESLEAHIRAQLITEEPYILGGDFNVALDDIDVYAPEKFRKRILFSPQERQALRRIINLGLTDVWRAQHPGQKGFSWWDYREGRFQRDEGVRIDYLFASPQAADVLQESGIALEPRGKPRPSDHTPVWGSYLWPQAA